jgi:hypothetical protein
MRVSLFLSFSLSFFLSLFLSFFARGEGEGVVKRTLGELKRLPGVL